VVGDPVIVALVVTAGMVQLIGAVIAAVAARATERARARTLLALLDLAGPGAVLTDRRPDGSLLLLGHQSSALALARGDAAAPAGAVADTGARGGRGGLDAGASGAGASEAGKSGQR
jgi:hypothetical protein